MAPRLEDLLADVVALESPTERFRKLGDLANGELASLIRTERGRIVAELRNRDPRPSWAEIGAELGITGERARQLHDETTKETIR